MASCYHGNAISICSTELKEVPFPPYFLLLLLWCPSCYCLRASRSKSGSRPISLPSFSKEQAGGEGGQGCDLPQSEFITQPLSLPLCFSFSHLLACSRHQSAREGRERAAAAARTTTSSVHLPNSRLAKGKRISNAALPTAATQSR